MKFFLIPFYLLFVIACAWTTECFGQINAPTSFKIVAYNFECDCNNETRVISIPSDYIFFKKSNYEEGILRTFVYADQSSITLLCGANAQLALPKRRKKNRYYCKGNIPNCCCQIMYINVPITRVDFFNRIMDDITKF